MDADPKIIRQTVIYPEKRNQAVVEFKMKTQIARTWLASDLAKVELLTESEETAQYLDLRVSITYDEWGYDDIKLLIARCCSAADPQ